MIWSVDGRKSAMTIRLLKIFLPVFSISVTRKVSGIKLHDFNCGLKSYHKRTVKGIEVYGEMHRYIPVLAKWAGFKHIGEKVVEHRAAQIWKIQIWMEKIYQWIS